MSNDMFDPSDEPLLIDSDLEDPGQNNVFEQNVWVKDTVQESENTAMESEDTVRESKDSWRESKNTARESEDILRESEDMVIESK